MRESARALRARARDEQTWIQRLLAAIGLS
jgi:hypothetical protein